MTNMPDYTDDFDEEGAGLVDEKAIKDILEKAEDALRSIGLTIQREHVSVTVQNGQAFAMIPALIRPSAKKKLVEDKESREKFNQMMADENEARIKAEADRIRNMTKDADVFAEAFFSDEPTCEHNRVHEGLCLDCSEEIPTE